MKAIELFAGAGGLGMGLSRAGFEPVRVVEFDRWCCDTLRENRSRGVKAISTWPEPDEMDVRLLNFKPLRGSIDLVSGGPPCQPFSLGGKHRAFKDSRDMWSEAVRAVRETAPKAFIFENVKGLTRAAFASYLAYIVHQLTYPAVERHIDETWENHFGRLERHHTGNKKQSTYEYRVVYRVMNSADYGVPQRRERVVLVGIRSDLGSSGHSRPRRILLMRSYGNSSAQTPIGTATRSRERIASCRSVLRHARTVFETSRMPKRGSP